MDARNALKEYLMEMIMDQGRSSIEPDEDLLTQGLIDSMGILQLVSFMEKKFNIKVPDEDIVPDNFRTLDSLTEYVTKRMS
jgi:acyl carrier protein